MGTRITRADARRLGLTLPPAKPPAVAVPGEPSVASATSPAPGHWFAAIDDWTPASKNVKGRGRRAWGRARRADDAAVALLCPFVPEAAGKRRVRFRVTVCGPGPLPDAQNLVESFCDACVNAGLLVDDSPAWCRVETPEVVRGARRETAVWFEDLPEEDGTRDNH